MVSIPIANVTVKLTDKDTDTLMAFYAVQDDEGRKLIETQTMRELWNFIDCNKKRYVFLEGPPGTGKSTTLYWLFSQCCALEGATPPWKTIVV